MATRTEASDSRAAMPGRKAARGQGPLPLVLGITGHRDLREEDIPALAERLQSIFTEFQQHYPHTPLLLLSPLAEGADRLAARMALQCGIRLVVPLPMAREEYLTDFDTPASRAEFTELLQQAERWFELPMLPGNTLESTRDQNAHRAEQYGLVGAYIVRRCQVLIALWNGVPGTEVGGTGQVVEFELQGIPDGYWEALAEDHGDLRGYLDPVEGALVYHIVTPRKNHPGVEGESLSLRTYFPGMEETGTEGPVPARALPLPGLDGSKPASTVKSRSLGLIPERFQRICGNMDAFNENALRIERVPSLRALRAQSAAYLLPDAEAATLPAGLQLLRARYAVADALAQHFQRLTLQVLVWLSALVFTAALLFEISDGLYPNNDGLMLFFPSLLAVTYVLWYTTVKRGRWQDRHQDYRALAEGMRVQFFWRLADLPISVSDHYLRKQRGELDWIRIAIQNMAGESPAAAPRADSERCFGLVMEHWVQNQARYYARSARCNEREREQYEAWIRSLVIASPVLAAVAALLPLLAPSLGDWMHGHEKLHKLLMIGVVVLAGLAGVLHTYIDKRALAQHAKQYERMSALFSLAERRLAQCAAADRLTERLQILRDLGKEALAENGDWVLTHRERPVDVPHAG